MHEGSHPLKEQIRVSVGTADVLRLARVRMHTAPTTAYLMLGERCSMSCGFCAQGRDSHAPDRALSRISWPPFAREAVIAALAEAFDRGKVHRCCLQVTVSQNSFAETEALLREIRSRCEVPVDASVLPGSMRQVETLFAAGLDHLGFGLDAACKRVFQQVKGGSWERIWEVIEATARGFRGHAAAHLIVGLGETEQEMLRTIQQLHDLGVVVGLFAFTPVIGTALADRPPPPLSVYRRIQAARWLIVQNVVRCEDLAFSAAGRLLGPARPEAATNGAWRELLSNGEAFRTSGCPDCNRPFYNERPGGVIYNYAHRLVPDEATAALQDCEFRS